MSDAPALELLNIRKRFGPVEALRGASLTVGPGEIHALVGENGAGKTTLMRIAYGLARPDSGTIRVRGAPATIRSPRDARRLGIGMVHQHPTAIPALTVAENIALTAGWKVVPPTLARRVAGLTAELGLPLDPGRYAGRLPVALKQRLEIVKALAAQATILLLDEPTAVLAPSEAEEFLRVVRQLTAHGQSAILITHKLPEALRVADRVTVLRRGQVTFSGPPAGETAGSLAAAMVGEEVAPAERPRPATPGQVLVHMEQLEVARDGRYGIALRGADLTIRAGEIVAVAAVEGNGERELLRAVAGVIAPLRGLLRVEGPVAFIPEDRTTEGLIPALSVTQNLALGAGERAPWVRGELVDWSEARRATAALIVETGISAAGPDAPAATLSGGNQQKVIVARALTASPRVIVAENPTRGLDIAAARAVHARLRAAAAEGAAVLFHSSDLDEILEESDRIVVLAGGQLRAADGRDRAGVGRMMVGAA